MPLHLMFLLIRIQIQHLLKLNGKMIGEDGILSANSNTTLVKVKLQM